jgi:hypothetical protein
MQGPTQTISPSEERASVKHVKDIFLANNRKPRELRQVELLAAWMEKNILPEKFARFTRLIVSKGIIPSIADLRSMLEEAPECSKKRTKSSKYIPDQEEPVESWCRKCMNSGLIHVFKYQNGCGYDVVHRCSCPAGNRYPWLKYYTDEFPDEMQFNWDPETEFYPQAYQRESLKIVEQNENIRNSRGSETLQHTPF